MLIRPMIAFAAATMLLAATTASHHASWQLTVTPTPTGGHLFGNPAAKLKLTEYISYTCPHCAHFYQEADAPLTIKYLSPGTTSVEVQPFLRNNVDVTVSLLSNCGPPSKFARLHRAFLAGQEGWMKYLSHATAGQQARWSSGTFASRQRAIASDAHLYDIMERNGFTRPDADRCLANEALARQMAKATEAAVKNGVNGTPSFAINGTLLENTYDWKTLEPQLRQTVQGGKPSV